MVIAIHTHKGMFLMEQQFFLQQSLIQGMGIHVFGIPEISDTGNLEFGKSTTMYAGKALSVAGPSVISYTIFFTSLIKPFMTFS